MRTERIVRRAAAWRALRPSGESLGQLADLILGVTCDDAELARVVHELAMWSRFAEAETATANMIADHNRRAARGIRRLPPLTGKQLGFYRCFRDRAGWALLACR
jgi:hypothetical protein